MAPLENIILKIKQFDVERIHIVLGLAMDPPKMDDVVSSVISLKELGSLLPICEEDEFSIVDGYLTPLGKIQVSKYVVNINDARRNAWRSTIFMYDSDFQNSYFSAFKNRLGCRLMFGHQSSLLWAIASGIFNWLNHLVLIN